MRRDLEEQTAAQSTIDGEHPERQKVKPIKFLYGRGENRTESNKSSLKKALRTEKRKKAPVGTPFRSVPFRFSFFFIILQNARVMILFLQNQGYEKTVGGPKSFFISKALPILVDFTYKCSRLSTRSNGSYDRSPGGQME